MSESAFDAAEQQPYTTSNTKWLARLGASLPDSLPGAARVLIAADKPNLLRDLIIGLLAAALGVITYGSFNQNDSSVFIVGVIVVFGVFVAALLRREAAEDTIFVGEGWLAQRKVTGSWTVIDLRHLTEIRVTPPAVDDPPPVKVRGLSLDGQEVRCRIRSQAWDKAVRPHLLSAPEVPASMYEQIVKPLPIRVFGREAKDPSL